MSVVSQIEETRRLQRIGSGLLPQEPEDLQVICSVGAGDDDSGEDLQNGARELHFKRAPRDKLEERDDQDCETAKANDFYRWQTSPVERFLAEQRALRDGAIDDVLCAKKASTADQTWLHARRLAYALRHHTEVNAEIACAESLLLVYEAMHDARLELLRAKFSAGWRCPCAARHRHCRAKQLQSALYDDDKRVGKQDFRKEFDEIEDCRTRALIAAADAFDEQEQNAHDQCVDCSCCCNLPLLTGFSCECSDTMT